MDLLFFIEVNLVYFFNLEPFVRKPLFQWLRPHKLFSVTNEFFQTRDSVHLIGKLRQAAIYQSCIHSDIPFWRQIPICGYNSLRVENHWDMEPVGVTGIMYRISNTWILSVVGGSSLTIYLFFLFNFFYCIYFNFFFIVLSWSCRVLSI